MKNLYACTLLVMSVTVACGDGPSLKEARQRWLHGNYEEARSLYEVLVKDANQRAPATVGLSRTLQSQGDYDKALEVVDVALGDHPASADLHAGRAEILYLRGRWTDALGAAEKALALKAGHFLGRWIRGQVARDRADFKRADVEFRWFVRTYTERSDKDDDIKDPQELLLVGLAGAENARWHNLSDQFRIILNDVYGDALKNDKDFWPAEYQAGMLLLEKYNRGEALDAFDKALVINPNAAEALVGKGIAALQKYEVKDAERFAERALAINPNLPEALRLRADVEFRWFVRTYTERSDKDDDIKDHQELLLVGLAGAENARWHNRKSAASLRPLRSISRRRSSYAPCCRGPTTASASSTCAWDERKKPWTSSRRPSRPTNSTSVSPTA